MTCSFWIHKMGKKSKSKTPREMQDNASTVEEEKASSSAKKPTSEIDEVFAGKKRKGPETEKAKKPVEDGIEKPSSSAKKRTSEIDEIFAGKKTKKPETEKSKKPKNPNGDGIENPNKLNKKKKDKRIRDGGFGDLASKPKKRTQDGFAIYTEEELGISKEHLESNEGDPELLVYIPCQDQEHFNYWWC
ncbi:uncharacterized protein LOC110744827 isoform X4 [Prunus avium]|uniref:Uncharacterized protein LOC110744827 isoform X4 n=1 Tax=Prunus avium TaxID=42229 RepID=A0A6P5R6I2_PRUAV|nr:uncharacterized protein LOC110744827 isoform X4 [Prunus avium]